MKNNKKMSIVQDPWTDELVISVGLKQLILTVSKTKKLHKLLGIALRKL